MVIRFILLDILMLSLGAILYIMVRALPRIEENHHAEGNHSFIDRLVHSEIPHKIDLMVQSYSWKFFRKLKVYLMKFDNYLTHRLTKMNTNMNGNGKPKIDFKDITSTDSGAGEESK